MPTILIPATYNEYRPGQSEAAFSVLEQEIAYLAQHDPLQRRPFMKIHPILNKAASMKCLDKAARDYGGHTDPDGHGPNWLVRSLGYRLPDEYGDEDDDNNIESLLNGGNGKPARVWERWLASESHRNHVLGLNSFYAAQTNFGVGYAMVPEDESIHFWCFLSAPPEP